MVEQETQESKKSIVLDCNLWIKIVSELDSDFTKHVLTGNYLVILTSYMVVEILRVLKRLSRRLPVPSAELESLFWDFCFHENILMNFDHPFADSLIAETKRLPEYQIIARLLDLETKDIPYLVTAFQYKAILISDNLRSLVYKRDLIEEYLGVSIKSSKEFLEKA